jgi:hypothetical protein
MDETELRERLSESFDPDPAVLDAAVREAMRFDESGLWEYISDEPLTAGALVKCIEIADKPLKPSWNWWFGMNASFREGDYQRYQI